MYEELYLKEGFEPFRDSNDGKMKVRALGQVWGFVHPVSIYFKLFRDERNPELKYQWMKKCHDYLWPHHEKTWNYWTERRFRAYCSGYNFVSYAGGASTAKSFDAAKIAILDFFADPKRRGVIVASTTLKSLEGRIWGYVLKLIKEAKVPLPYFYKKSPSPSITYEKPVDKKERGKAEDTLHGMLAIAAGKGSDSETIKNWIGRHPENGLLVILDEGTDMPNEILDAVPNLDMAQGGFRLMIIGNSCSRFDLHGILSTPKVGWDKIDPMRDNVWETTQRNGICLFFSCYESPAIHEIDPERKKVLEKFFITQEMLDRKKVDPGEFSEGFWRFTLGFWRNATVDNVVVTEQFLLDYKMEDRAEFSGVYPLQICAGLDLSFSVEGGGDGCILRLGYLGVDVAGNVVLDLRKERLLFKIPIVVNANKSAELQIADAVLDILQEHNCPLRNLCFDGSGAGRAMGATIALTHKDRRGGSQLEHPLRIFSVKHGVQQKNQEPGTYVKSHFELWYAWRDFIQKGQVKGMDNITKLQMTTRLIITNEKTKAQSLEEKKDYKKRMAGILPELARSPDEADAASFLLQSAILNFGFFPGQKKDVGGTVEDIRAVDFRNMIVSLQEHQRIKSENKMGGIDSVRRGAPIKSGFGNAAGLEALVKHRRF